MYESRDQRQAVAAWVDAQAECPSRKQAKRQFPNVDQKHIRAAIQSRRDRDRQHGDK